MTDQTPVTDDDRAAHEWCDSPARQSTEALAPIIRAIRAHVPAPPKSLADELRASVQDLHQVVELGTFDGLEETVMDIADRVEAVEKELAGTKRDYTECQEELIEDAREREGVLAPAPQIIRTVEELEALDRDSVVTSGAAVRPAWALQWDLRHGQLSEKALPAVVVATGTHYRACREALEGEEA